MMTRRQAMVFAVTGAAAASIGGVAYASEGAAGGSDEQSAIDSTADGLRQIEQSGGIYLDNGEFVPVDLDALFDQIKSEADGGGDGGNSGEQLYWNWNRFGSCMAVQLGVTDVKLIVKAFSEPAVRRALKSRQWKVASSIAFRNLKRLSPKLARLIIKRVARSALPGGAVGMLVVAAVKCGIKAA